MRDLLLELGVEEIPATHLQPTEDFLRTALEKFFRDSALSYSGLELSSTPRRFFALAKEVQEQQADVWVIKTGPARKIAYDAEGKLTPAGLGFLKKNAATEAELAVESSDKGEFLVLKQLQPGRSTCELLQDWVKDTLPRIPFPKTMIWNASRLEFSRPLRWLCLLWGEDVIPVEIAGVGSDRYTYGNRYLGLGKALQVANPGQYLDVLRANGVLAARQERRDALNAGLAKVLSEPALGVVPDERLAGTVTDLVEYPTAVEAEFDARFLALPEKIITSTISQNQKYFSVQDGKGRLSNKFVFISNGDPACSEIIRKGNEKVVSARLNDAQWYFQEDTRVPLESYLPRLDEVVFQAKLGSMAAKSRRILELAKLICAKLELAPEQIKRVLRTAILCKADLVTTMLGEKEFTKLQGYIGQQYALASGEDQEVAAGIYEHYMPRGTNDGLPQTTSGAVVALADKLDTVCGIIGIGLVPTGSADPYALRRAANGVVQIIVDRGWELELAELLESALDLIAQDAELTATASADAQNFFRQRVEFMLKQMELDYDVVESVMGFSLGSPTQLAKRASALQTFRQRDDFLRLVIGFKRAANIIGARTEFPQLDSSLFQVAEERELHAQLQILKQDIDLCLVKLDFAGAISLLVAFGAHIDRFFDAVLVNCEDLALRGNRYALLNNVKSEFLRVADISRIIIDNET